MATVHQHGWQHQCVGSRKYWLAVQCKQFCLHLCQQRCAIHRLLDWRQWQSGPRTQTGSFATSCAVVLACHSDGSTSLKVGLLCPSTTCNTLVPHHLDCLVIRKVCLPT